MPNIDWNWNTRSQAAKGLSTLGYVYNDVRCTLHSAKSYDNYSVSIYHQSTIGWLLTLMVYPPWN